MFARQGVVESWEYGRQRIRTETKTKEEEELGGERRKGGGGV